MSKSVQDAIRLVELECEIPFDIETEEVTIKVSKNLLGFLRVITDGDEDEVNRLVAHEATEGIHGLVSAHRTPFAKE